MSSPPTSMQLVSTASTSANNNSDRRDDYNADLVKIRDEISRWNSYVDVLLLFTGLFSAVVTAFVIESLRDLREDYAKTSADLLRLLVNNSTNVKSAVFHPSPVALSVTALWLSSLSITLIAALGSMWGKLWAQNQVMESHEMRPAMSSQMQWENAKKSGQRMIRILPLLIHVAIILFIAGLITFIWDKALVLSGLLFVFVGLGALAYLYSNHQRKGKWYRIMIM